MSVAGSTRRDSEAVQPLRLPGTLDADRIVAMELADGTAVQGLRFLHDYEIQVSELIPPGKRAAVALHFVQRHIRRCQSDTCPDARVWLAESIRTPLPLVSA